MTAAFVQQTVGGAGAGVTTINLTLGSTPAAGDLIVVSTQGYIGGTDSTVTVSGFGVGSWSKSHLSANNTTIFGWADLQWGWVTGTPSTSGTVSWTGTGSSANCNASEWSGIPVGSTVVVPTPAWISTAASASIAFTATANTQLLLGSICTDSGNYPIDPSSPWVALTRQGATGTQFDDSQYQLNPSAGAQSLTWTEGGNDNYYTIGVQFDLAPVPAMACPRRPRRGRYRGRRSPLARYTSAPIYPLTSTVTSDFSSAPSGWTNMDATSIQVTGGVLQMTPTTNYWLYYHTGQLDLTDDSVLAQLVQPTNVGNGGIATFWGYNATSPPGSAHAEFNLNNGALTAQWFDAANNTNVVTSTAFSATNHAWMKLTYTKSTHTMTWWTAPDGQTWTSFGTASDMTWAPNAGTISFGSGFGGTEPSITPAQYDNLNLPPTGTVVTLTDSGAGTDALTVTATATAADTVAGTDALATTASATSADTGTGTDALATTATATATDSGTGADAFTAQHLVAVSDSGTGVDALTVAHSVTVADAGAGTDALATTANASAVDSGTGSDALATTAKPAGADTGTGSDALTTAATAAATDSGAGVDTIAATATATAADSGAGTDAVTVAHGVAVSDSGTGTEQFGATANATLSDTAAATDLLAVAATTGLTDSATGADQVAVTAITPAADLASGTDQLATAATVTAADTGSGTDALTVTVTTGLADSGTGTEGFSTGGSTSVSLSDTATGDDELAAAAGAVLADAASVIDAFAAVLFTELADQAAAVDTVGVAVAVGFADSGTGSDALPLAYLLSKIRLDLSRVALAFAFTAGHPGFTFTAGRPAFAFAASPPAASFTAGPPRFSFTAAPPTFDEPEV